MTLLNKYFKLLHFNITDIENPENIVFSKHCILRRHIIADLSFWGTIFSVQGRRIHMIKGLLYVLIKRKAGIILY